MSSIDIYRVLRKIPNVSDDEAKQGRRIDGDK